MTSSLIIVLIRCPAHEVVITPYGKPNNLIQDTREGRALAMACRRCLDLPNADELALSLKALFLGQAFSGGRCLASGSSSAIGYSCPINHFLISEDVARVLLTYLTSCEQFMAKTARILSFPYLQV